MIKRAFEAVRIAVNQEVINLKQFLKSCLMFYTDTQKSCEILGREKRADLPGLLMVITFHSLEERLVSQAFATWKSQN